MRFGLVGTGPWAAMTHGPGLAGGAAREVELVGVWGRSREKAAELAQRLHTTPFETYGDLLAHVDAVAFAVPPAVQADLALLAARAGKHLLLEKPVAADVGGAHALRDAAHQAGVASVVFFTDRFVEDSRAWFSRVAATGGWQGGWVRWFSSLQELDNPFGGSPWRRERGALWDIGPHALSTLSACLGPIVSVSASAGRGDLVTLGLEHEDGALSTATLTQFAPPAAGGFEAAVWGASGLSYMPPRPTSAHLDAYATAAEELVAAAVSGEPHPVGVAFGTRVVDLIADAQSQLDARRSVRAEAGSADRATVPVEESRIPTSGA